MRHSCPRHALSNRSYELREFLARNQVPYQWIDVELAQSIQKCAG